MRRRTGWLCTQAAAIAAGVALAGLTTAAAAADTGSGADSDAPSVSAPRSPKAADPGTRGGPGRHRQDRSGKAASSAGADPSTAHRGILGKRRATESAESADDPQAADVSTVPADAVVVPVAPATGSGHAAAERAVVVAVPTDKIAVSDEQPAVAPTVAIDKAGDDIKGGAAAVRTVALVAIRDRSAITGAVPAPGAEPAGAVAAASRTEVVTAAAPVGVAAATAPAPTLIGTLSALVFGVFTSLERLLTGPARVPAGSTVTVQGSSLVVGGITVPADWYFPASADPPTRLILLQHGFLATGAMYSVTAATLAEETNSIVVVPTLTSNPLADGGLWINGAGMQQAVAALFYGDRAALTASALAAGYATRYGLDADDAVLPTKFVLAGHSAGGAMVSAAAGYIVNSDAADDLMGVLLLDAVSSDLAPALVELDDYQKRSDRYIPVREIGAPPSAWNSISTVNAALSADRPNRFNGVVLSGGVHTDSMGGGGVVAEFIYHLLAGFPTAQNTAALQQLAVEWVDDWFDRDTDEDDDLVHGSTITIDTPAGPATATVIGTAPAASAQAGAQAA